MLTFLMNRLNIPECIDAEKLKKEFPEGIGIAADLSREKKKALFQAVKIVFYDSMLELDIVSEQKFSEALAEAASYGAKVFLLRAGGSCDRGTDEAVYLDRLKAFREKAEQQGMKLLFVNRKRFSGDRFMSFEKFIRLAENADVKIAHDLGYSHAQASALENYYDFEERTELLLLNDNFGREANGKADWCSGDLMIPDEMKQPGYGTLPIEGMMRMIRKRHPDWPICINGSRYRDADLKQVMLETKTLLGGRVFVSPAMARKGRNEAGRLLI